MVEGFGNFDHLVFFDMHSTWGSLIMFAHGKQSHVLIRSSHLAYRGL